MVHRKLLRPHLQLHAQLHDELVFRDDLVLRLVQLEVPVPQLGFQVLHLDL